MSSNISVQEASSLDTLPQIKNVEGSFVHVKLSPWPWRHWKSVTAARDRSGSNTADMNWNTKKLELWNTYDVEVIWWNPGFLVMNSTLVVTCATSYYL